MSAVQMNSPTRKEPPPAPKARQGLLKSFQGSMLLLVTKPTAESFETVDPDRKSLTLNTGNRGSSSLFRASDLFSQGRSSASSFGSRGSFSGLFPARPSSAPLDPNSRDHSPAASPRNSLSREDQDRGSGGELRHSLSSTMVSALKKTKGDFSRKLREKLSIRSSNLSVKSIQEQTGPSQKIASPEPVNLPSYVKVSKPQMQEKSPHRAPESPAMKPSTPAPVASPTEKAVKAAPVLEPKPASLETVTFSDSVVGDESKGVVEDVDDNDGATRNIVFRAADLETISVLASRIGDRASARVVVRISRSAEMFMRGETRSCLELIDLIKCRDPPPLRYCFDEQGELIEGEREEDEFASCTRQFYGEKRPKIALDRYLGRLVRYLDSFSECGCGVDSMGVLALVGGAILVDRLALKRDFVLDSMNTHRVFMVATLIALKVLDDEPCSNEYYANVGGVDMAELNALEINMLKALDYDVTIHAFELKAALRQFVGPTATTAMFNQCF